MVTRCVMITSVVFCACGSQAFTPTIQSSPISFERGSSSSISSSSRARTWLAATSTITTTKATTLQTAKISQPTAEKYTTPTPTSNHWREAKRGLAAAAAAAASVFVAMSLFFSQDTLVAFADGLPGSGAGCSTTTNPSFSMVSCERTGLDRDGRLLGCSSAENCLSTSAVRIPGKLGSPWEYARQTDDADRAFASLVRAVESTSGVTVKTIDTKGHYVLAQFPSKVPPGSVDYVEFLVKPADQIVLYRSVSRDTLFLYPLQQPVSDQGNLKGRLEGIRKELGWGMYTYQGE